MRVLVFLTGAYIATFLDQMLPSATVAATPQISGSIAASADESLWITISYATAYYVGLLLAPWLQQRYGYKRHYVASLFGLAAACGLSTLAPNLATFSGCRMLEGAFASGIFINTLYAISVNFSRD